MYDKDLVSRICEELLQLNNRRTNNPVFQMGKGFEYIFVQRKINK